MSFPSDTITALATPGGTSAIAVVRVSGPAVKQLIPIIFAELPPPRFVRHADYKDRHGALVDDVLFTFFAAPNSFTGEDSLEISSHGNPFIAQKILEDLLARGCRPAEPGEFSKRAFLNGRLDLSQAEAVMDLIHARSDRALAAANQQLRGALGRKMKELIDRLLGLLANIEAYIDFPDEDLPAEDRQSIAGGLDLLLTETSRLLATSHYGDLLRDGIKTVIIGEPNAGKSSLLNRLVGRDRALVSAEPGTTRDYLEERLVIGAHCFRLIDTAGLNPAPANLEKLGIEKTLEQATEADLFLWVVDSTKAVPLVSTALVGRMHPSNTILVLNKADLVQAAGSSASLPYVAISISALNGTGLEALEMAMVKIADSFEVGGGTELIAINARHFQSLTEAGTYLENAKLKLTKFEHSELLASDLRGALETFSTISGKVDNERMLDQLFAKFCIGK
jgi:tRNA modification GTPase